jgi:zeaxanthin glucosyltransferase
MKEDIKNNNLEISQDAGLLQGQKPPHLAGVGGGCIIFLCQNLTGHLNPTIGFAKKYIAEGNTVYYGSTHDTIAFTQKHGFKLHPMNSLPFATGIDTFLHEKSKDSWLESLIDRFTDKHYKIRKRDLEEMLEEINPDIIFIDEFNYSDFIILYPHCQNRKIVYLQTKFPMYRSDTVPPLNTFASSKVGKVQNLADLKRIKWLWQKHRIQQNWNRTIQYLKYFGKSDLAILSQKFKAYNIPANHKIIADKCFRPAFANIEEWFLVPKALDFPEQKLLPWQQYVEPIIDLERKEELPNSYLQFLERKEANETNKLIYCSLGTALEAHLRHNKKVNIELFYQKIIDIAQENPNLYIILKLEKQYLEKIKTKADNLLLLDIAPQLDILKKFDLFMTHAGMGSLLEAIAFNVPMVLFPLNKVWDQKGTAARMVKLGFGEKSDFNEPKNELVEKILRNLKPTAFLVQ